MSLLERSEEPSDIGAGIMLQHLGLQVMDRLGLGAALREVSRPIRRVDGRTVGGRRVMDFGYADVPGAEPALGVHRGALFSLLHEAVLAADVDLRTGVAVTGVRPTGDRVEVTVESAAGPVPWGTADLVVGADGVRSVVRGSIGVTLRDHPYAYGALWAVVPDPEEIAADVLHQRFSDTRHYLGVLPTGRGQSSIFWSIRTDRMAAALAAGTDAWREEADRYAGRYGPLLDRVDHLLTASYRDVVVRRPFRLAPDGDGRAGVALVGDSWHAMSPQLGTGAPLALADAWTLACCLETATELPRALSAYADLRRAHVRWYAWWTRLMMPGFQSALVPVPWVRDAVAEPVARVPVVRRQLVSTLMGHRTSPWSVWALP